MPSKQTPRARSAKSTSRETSRETRDRITIEVPASLKKVLILECKNRGTKPTDLIRTMLTQELVQGRIVVDLPDPLVAHLRERADASFKTIAEVIRDLVVQDFGRSQ